MLCKQVQHFRNILISGIFFVDFLAFELNFDFLGTKITFYSVDPDLVKTFVDIRVKTNIESWFR